MTNNRQMSSDEAEKLAYSPDDLERFMRRRLVQLAEDDGAVAVRAIEMLRQWPIANQNRNLSNVPTNILKELHERALQYIIGAGSRQDDHDGTRAP